MPVRASLGFVSWAEIPRSPGTKISFAFIFYFDPNDGNITLVPVSPNSS